MTGKILLIDDEKDMLLLLRRILNEETEHEVVTESDPHRALALFRENSFDLVLTDLKMPKISGIEVLEKVKRISPEVSVIILTAFATIDNAVDAIHKGAYDYLTKPFQRERLLLTIEKAMALQKLVRENMTLRQALAEKDGQSLIIGSSPFIKDMEQRIRQVGPTMATVLVTGPSGTGKELVARAVHNHSRRRDSKLVTVNCTALPAGVLESELFGHVKGAFTGALRDKKGLVEEARGGTLFLDEIGDLNPLLQTTLLRLLQEGEYKPVGSVVTKRADVRFIAATNHNLKQDIREKRFREDLYYRLNVINLEMAPLSGRRGDIPLLAYHFLKKYSRLNQKRIQGISPVTLQVLMSLDYPGNIRELENIIERGVIFCQTNTLTPSDLSLDVQDPVFPDRAEDTLRMPFKEAKDRVVQVFHHRYIGHILAESDGNISQAAEMAGIQRQYLHRLMKDVGISTEEYKKGGVKNPTSEP